MTTMTQHAAGTFCWAQLSTPDEASAKKFYAALFGWKLENTTVGQGPSFTLVKKGENPVGAIMGYDSAEPGMGPSWTTFVAVDDADRTAATVERLGGKVLMKPMDAGDNGRMALFQDPLRAIFAVWQAGTKPGAAVVQEPGAMGWNELITSDTSKVEPFYRQLFGWRSEIMEPDRYSVFKRGDTLAAGMVQAKPETRLTHPYWLVYFVVDDCDASAVKAKQLGGHVQAAPTDIPNVGRFAVLTDPEEVRFAVFEPGPQR